MSSRDRNRSKAQAESASPFGRGAQSVSGGALSTGGWATSEDVNALVKDSMRWILDRDAAARMDQPLRHYHPGCIFLGETDDEDRLPIGWKDDRHIITIAGSRAGKGTSAIIPNLFLCSDSVFCIDPKGENAERTATMRAKPRSKGGLGQEVYVLDPFRVSGVKDEFQATYNPLWSIDLKRIDALEQVSAMAESMVVPADPKDEHWDSSARDLIEALILHILTWPKYRHARSLTTLRRILVGGDPNAMDAVKRNPAPHISFPPGIGNGPTTNATSHFDILLDSMLQNTNFDGAISGQAQNLIGMGTEERGSVLSTARRNTKFLDGSAIPANLKKSRHNLTMKRFRLGKHGATVFLCLPARYMVSHSRWLRLILNSLMVEVESTPRDEQTPILAILDEFPILGHMKKLESAIGFMAGFGLRIWTVLQDINQIVRDYPRSWETFLGNAGVSQYFGNSDHSTLKYASDSLGEVEVAPVIRSAVETEQLSVTKLSEEDFKERLKKQSLFGRVTAEESDFEQNTITTSNQTTRAPMLMKTALMTPDEIGREFGRYTNKMLLITHDLRPIRINRVNHHKTDPGYWPKLNSSLTKR